MKYWILYTAISIKVVHEQSGKVEYGRERLLGIAYKLMNFQSGSFVKIYLGIASRKSWACCGLLLAVWAGNWARGENENNVQSVVLLTFLKVHKWRNFKYFNKNSTNFKLFPRRICTTAAVFLAQKSTMWRETRTMWRAQTEASLKIWALILPFGW
jgi:type IV secretory pathway VirB3-like protein